MTLDKERVTDELYEVRCPACRRKLMSVRTVNNNEPIVGLLAQKKGTHYTAETRCPSCKVYVGIKN